MKTNQTISKSQKKLRIGIGILFLILYMTVATISAICSINFFLLSHTMAMSICLAVAFEIGAMCSLCASVFMKGNRSLSFLLFIILTLFQMMGNVFHSYVALNNFIPWIELFGLQELELIAQKRIVAIVSGAILPLVSLGFIKCFIDYNDDINENIERDKINNQNNQEESLFEENNETNLPLGDEEQDNEEQDNEEVLSSINSQTNEDVKKPKSQPKKGIPSTSQSINEVPIPNFYKSE